MGDNDISATILYTNGVEEKAVISRGGTQIRRIILGRPKEIKRDGLRIIFNSEGSMIGLPVNSKATSLAGLTVVGPAIIIDERKSK